MTATRPRVTFGLIVLNGEPFLRYNLRALYPFAHQIIVIEGAVLAAASAATPDGHSTDGTRETLRRFQAEEDPQGKVVVATAEDDGHPSGFWPGEKDEQSRAYARRATGDYLWQVDADEFYHPDDMARVLARLAADPKISGAAFPQITLWGGFDHWVDGWYLRGRAGFYQRLFRWGPGYRYVRHRPPTVAGPDGRDLRQGAWLSGRQMARLGVRIYHYSLVFPRQVLAKSAYYARAGWNDAAQAERWAETSFERLERPYRVHNVYQYPSWLNRFHGRHPPQIEALRADLAAGRLAPPGPVRPTEDVERLLASPVYRLGRAALMLAAPIGAVVAPHWVHQWWPWLKSGWRDPLGALRRWRKRRHASHPP